MGRTEKLRLTILFDEPDDDRWIVPVFMALSQGRTREEARENVIGALSLMLAPDEADENAGGSEPLELFLQS